MSSSCLAIYECNILRNKKKAGKLKTDDNGYFELTLGAFDCMSAKGEFYEFTNNLKHMFEDGSPLQRRILTGNLRGEVEHPMPLPGESIASFMGRVRQIRMDKVGHHIKKVRLEKGKDHNGNDIILCIGLVKGSGPFGAQFDSRLQNPDENVDMSIRSMTKAHWVNGTKHKRISAIITWDQVNEGGIRVANKLDTPSMEGIDCGFEPELMESNEEEITVSEMVLRQSEAISQTTENLGFESAETVDFTYIRDALGWNKVQLISPRSSANW